MHMFSNCCEQVLLLLAVATATIPMKYLVDALFFGGGFFFWHVVPVMLALGSEGRARCGIPAISSATTLNWFI
jgi:hypothetical protein